MSKMLRRPPIVGGGGTSGITAGGVDGFLHRGIPSGPLRTWKDCHDDERSESPIIPRRARPSRSPLRTHARPSSAAAVVAPRAEAEFERTTSTTKALPPPRPADADAPPLMLLTGDEFHVGSDGICRTLYRLVDSNNGDDAGNDNVNDDGGGCYTVEESFHLERARKKFVLRGPASDLTSRGANQPAGDDPERSCRGCGANEVPPGPLPLGPRLFELDLREIDGGAGGPAGTGAATWESSIAMALHFARRPDLLGGGVRGGPPRDVIELGSGVGAGGILTKVATDIAATTGRSRRKNAGEADTAASGNCHLSPPCGPVRSITLTDTSPEVLARAGENVRRAGIGHGSVEVRALDWNDDFDRGDYVAGGVDVIASDCVYSRNHVVPLADAISTLLGPPPDGGEGVGGGSEGGTAHLFGPCNRAPLGEMVGELGDERRGLDVRVDTIEMERCRLRPRGWIVSATDPDPSTRPHTATTGAAGYGGGGGGERRDDDDLAAASLGADDGGHVIASRNVAKLVYIRASRGRCTEEGGSPASGPRTNEGSLCGID